MTEQDDKINDEVERRVNMRLMAKQVAEIHEKLNGKDGICDKVENHGKQLSWIKGIGFGVTAVLGYFIKRG